MLIDSSWKITILTGIIIALAGALSGFWLRGTQITSVSNKKIATKENSENNLRFIPDYTKDEPKEVLGVSGIIKEIKEKSILIETVIPGKPPITREAIIESETKIIKQTQKDPVVLNKEFEASVKLSKTTSLANTTIPQTFSFEETEIQFADLKKGDLVFVQATENIKDRENFIAKIISLPPKLLIPELLPPSSR